MATYQSRLSGSRINIENGTDRLSQNVGNNTNNLHGVKFQKSADLIYNATEG
jgi:hypothetical protein